MYQHHVQRLQHKVPDDFVKRPYSARGPIAITGCTVTSYLLTTKISTATVYIIHFFLCGQIRFPIALWKGTCVCVSVSIRVRSVQLLMIL
jgi:hypothetical protein